MNGPTTSLFRAGFPRELLGEIAFVGGGGFVCLFVFYFCVCFAFVCAHCPIDVAFVLSPRSALSVA